jgi:hypothetical protein
VTRSWRGRAVAVGVVLSATAFAIWAGCAGSRARAPDGSGGSESGAGGSGGSGASTGGTGEAAPVDAQAREPCVWPGWYRAPQLPEGCMGLCIPDDVKKRVPKITWTGASWCSGCTKLALSNFNASGYDVSAEGIGGGSLLAMTLGYVDQGSKVETWRLTGNWDSSGAPTLAWRTNMDAEPPCGRSADTVETESEIGTVTYGRASSPHSFYAVPLTQAASLMTDTHPLVTWPLSDSVPQNYWFSSSLVAVWFLSGVSLGLPATGKTLDIAKIAGAPAGEWTDAQVVGNVAFVSHYAGQGTDWYVYSHGKLSRFLGGAVGEDIHELVTDGKVMVWTRGTNPTYDAGPIPYFQHYDVYEAPYTTDPATLQPRVLLADSPVSLNYLRMANGYVVGVYSLPGQTNLGGAIVLRPSDGRVWESVLPDKLSWGYYLYPSPTELIGPVGTNPATSHFETVGRVPYAGMQVLQSGYSSDAGTASDAGSSG